MAEKAHEHKLQPHCGLVQLSSALNPLAHTGADCQVKCNPVLTRLRVPNSGGPVNFGTAPLSFAPSSRGLSRIMGDSSTLCGLHMKQILNLGAALMIILGTGMNLTLVLI